MDQARQVLKVRYQPLSRPLPPSPSTTERDFLLGDVAKMDLNDLFGVFVFILIAGTCVIGPIVFALEWILGKWKKRVAKRGRGAWESETE